MNFLTRLSGHSPLLSFGEGATRPLSTSWGLRVSTILITLTSLSSLVFAGPPTDFLKGKVKEVRTLIAQPTPTAAIRTKIDGELMKVISPLMNFPKMSAATLGKRWPTLKEEERSRFIKLFQELVFHSYTKKIRSAKEGYSIQYEDEELKAKGAFVEAFVKTKKAEIELGFHLFTLTAGGYEVDDVIIDEVSLVENYKEAFQKIIKDKGMKGLFKKMEDQLKKVKGS